MLHSLVPTSGKWTGGRLARRPFLPSLSSTKSGTADPPRDEPPFSVRAKMLWGWSSHLCSVALYALCIAQVSSFKECCLQLGHLVPQLFAPWAKTRSGRQGPKTSWWGQGSMTNWWGRRAEDSRKLSTQCDCTDPCSELNLTHISTPYPAGSIRGAWSTFTQVLLVAQTSLYS